MQKQNGNFLLQALLALTLVFSFMPFFANKLSSRDTEARLYSVSSQIESVHNVARIFLRDEFRNNYPSGTITFSKNPSNCPSGYNCNFSVLESFGLPMGFNPQTIFNQDISLVATREVRDGGEIVVNGYINLTRGDLTGKNLEWAQLLRMLGMYASGDGVDINNSTSIHIVVPVEEPYSDVVLKHETDENIGFLTELDMNDNSINGVNVLYANKGIAEDVKVYNDLYLNSIETPRLECKSAVFYAPNGPWDVLLLEERRSDALSLSGTTVNTKTAIFSRVSCKESGEYCGGMTVSENVYANDFQMLPDLVGEGNNSLIIKELDEASGFEAENSINGDVELANGLTKVYDDNITVNNFFGVYFAGSLSNLDRSPELRAEHDVGTRVRDTLYGNRVVLSNSETVKSFEEGVRTFRSITPDIDINLSESVSLIPDVLLVQGEGGVAVDINTSVPFMHSDIYDSRFTYTRCADGSTGLFNERGGFFASNNFLKNSLVQNILCQYAFYHRLERRINHKLIIRCIRDGACQ